MLREPTILKTETLDEILEDGAICEENFNLICGSHQLANQRIVALEAQRDQLTKQVAAMREKGDAMQEVMVDSTVCDFLEPSEDCKCDGCKSIAAWNEAKGTK